MNTVKNLPNTQLKTGLRRLTLGFVAVLLLWALSWQGLPPLLKSQLESRLGEQLGRRVSVGAVDFKPWTLELTLSDVAVDRPTAGGLPQLSIQRLYIDMELQSLLRLAPVVDAVLVESPHLHLTHLGAGHYDFDDVLTKLSASNQASDAAAAPLRFALYNLRLTDGALELTDQPLGKVHRLSQLQISLPFLSNLDSQRQVLVQPKLAFDLNGSRFDSSANTTPFAQTRKTDAQLVVKDFNLAPYLAYLPAGLPLRLSSAVLNADVKVVFEQTPKTAVTLSGLVTASQVQLLAAQSGSELLAFDSLSLPLTDVQPLAHKVQLGHVVLTHPRLNLQRSRTGLINLLALMQAGKAPQNAIKNKASNQVKETAKGKYDLKTEETANASNWHFGATAFELQAGNVLWQDQASTKPVQLTLKDLNMHSQLLTWPLAQAVPFEGSAQLGTATASFKGSASDQQAQLSATLANLPLSLGEAYVAELIDPTLQGQLNAALELNWTAAKTGQVAQTRLQVVTAKLDQLALVRAQKTLASIGQVQLKDLALDMNRRSVTLGQVLLKQPKIDITRAADPPESE